MKPEDLTRVEVDFLAADRDGHLALFTTGGSGPVPGSLLRYPSPSDLPDPEAAVIRELEATGSSRSEGRGPGLCKEWVEVGRRGVFVYDFRALQGPFELVVRPSSPTFLSDSPGPIRDLIEVKIAGCFLEEDEITPSWGGA